MTPKFPAKLLTVITMLTGLSAHMSHAADVIYPTAITAADNVLISGAIPGAPTTGQVKIGGGQIHAMRSVLAAGGFQVSGPFPTSAGVRVLPGTMSYEYPVVRHYMGDGTGYSWRLSTSSATGVTSDKFRVHDNGFVEVPQGGLTVTSPINQGISVYGPGASAALYEDADTPGWMRFRPYSGAGFMFSNNGDTARMVVKESGEVGIGVANPTRQLQVYSTNGLAMKIENNGSGNAVLEIQSDQDAQTAVNFCRADGASMGQVAYYQGAAQNYMTLRTNSLERLRIDNQGNVGVGTTNPSQRLHVDGTSRLGNYIYAGTGPSAGGYIGSNIYYNGTNYSKAYAGANAGGWKIGNSNGGTGDIYFQTSAWGADATNLTDGTFPTRMSISSTGEVIVYGTVPAPAGSIDGQIRMGGGRIMVGGTLSAKEIKVTTTGADYVFEDGYQLRSLADVERFIKEHRHLPNMMPAKVMQADGMPVSEVVTRQLEKIEELTLYAIEAQKERDTARTQAEASRIRMEAALAQISELEKRMQKLEAHLQLAHP